jgi:hypothetical protein
MKRKITRRSLLIGSATGAALAATATLAPGSGVAATVAPSSSADQTLTFLKNTTSLFREKLELYFPGLAEDATFSSLAPTAALLIPTGAAKLWAFTVCWRITDSDGVYRSPLSYYSRPGSKRIRRPGITVSSGGKFAADSSDPRLVTPFFTLKSSYYKSLPTVNWQALINRNEPCPYIAHKLQGATRVAVSLDAAILSDGRVLGPDKHKLAKRLESARNGEKDEGIALAEFIASGASDLEIAKMLSSHIFVPSRTTGRPVESFWYERAKSRHAAFLLRIFNDKGRDKLTRVAQRLQRQPYTKITRAAA